MALRRDPDRVDAHAGLAEVSVYLYSLGLDESPRRIALALDEAHRAVDLDAGDAHARRALALAHAASDRLTPALKEAREAVRLDPGSSEAAVALSVILRLRGDLEEALEEARRAADLDPDSPRPLIALAGVLRDQGRYGEAMEMYGQAIDLDHEAIVPQLGAAATLHLRGGLSLAGRTYDMLIQQWDYARDRALLGAAGVLVADRRFEDALEVYNRIEIPDNASLPTLLALYGKGYCLLQLEREAEAEYFLSTLIERVPPDYDGPERGREFLFRAYDDLVEFFSGRGKEGRVEALLRSGSSRAMAPTRLARRLAGMLLERGREKDAVRVLAGAIERSDPREDPLELGATALLLVRSATADGRKRLAPGSAASGALDRAAERLSESLLGVVHYRLARARALAGDPERAVESLERARLHGYLPLDLLRKEADFDPIRGERAFRDLLDP